MRRTNLVYQSFWYNAHLNDLMIVDNGVFPCSMQDSIVNDVRRILFEAISSFSGNLENAEDLLQLIEAELTKLQTAFHITLESQEHDHGKVANKLLDLYRTGRLGHYILDPIPVCS